MSCLDYPRIHFNGKFSTNVCTANNDDMNVFDPAKAGKRGNGLIDPDFYPIVNPVDTTLHPNLAKMSKTDAQTWLKSNAKGAPSAGITVPNAGWNLFGDHIVTFEGATVSKVDLGPNDSCTANNDLIGASVTLPRNAKMVDVDPTGSANTQIYFGGFNLASGSMGVNYDSFKSRKGRVSYSRLLGPRNMSVGSFTQFQSVWQFSIPNSDELTFPGAENNEALAKLAQQAGDAQGLLVQFCAYYVQPLISTAQLVEDFAAGKRTHNPAVGHMVGTVGVWHEHDRATLPNGRNLAPQQVKTKKKGPSKYDFLNPVAAKLQEDKATVSLNLIVTFPEQFAASAADAEAQEPLAMKDARTPPKDEKKTFPPLAKVSFGALTLAVQNGSDVTPLGPIKGYDDYDAYRASAGIVEVPIDPKAADLLTDGDLLIQSDDGTVLFRETPFFVETDDHAVYLEQGDAVDISVNMRLRGEPYNGPVTMQYELVASTYGFNQKYFPLPPNAASASFEARCSNGTLKGRVTAGKNTSLGIVSCLASLPEGNMQSNCAVSLRIYPDEDYSNPPAAERSWQEVYDITLKYYDYIFPGMGEILDLSDEELVTSQASAFLYVLDTPMENTQYMPVTRALPPARRDLLVNWLRAKSELPPRDAVS